MKHSAKYVNRYGDFIEFHRVSEWKIEMLGGQYYRYAWETDEDRINHRYCMIDPSGGPYMSRGSNMGRFNKEWEGLIINYIDNNHILCMYEGRMVRAVVNDKEEMRWYDASGDEYKTYNDIDEFLKERKHNEQQ